MTELEHNKQNYTLMSLFFYFGHVYNSDPDYYSVLFHIAEGNTPMMYKNEILNMMYLEFYLSNSSWKSEEDWGGESSKIDAVLLGLFQSIANYYYPDIRLGTEGLFYFAKTFFGTSKKILSLSEIYNIYEAFKKEKSRHLQFTEYKTVFDKSLDEHIKKEEYAVKIKELFLKAKSNKNNNDESEFIIESKGNYIYGIVSKPTIIFDSEQRIQIKRLFDDFSDKTPFQKQYVIFDDSKSGNKYAQKSLEQIKVDYSNDLYVKYLAQENKMEINYLIPFDSRQFNALLQTKKFKHSEIAMTYFLEIVLYWQEIECKKNFKDYAELNLKHLGNIFSEKLDIGELTYEKLVKLFEEMFKKHIESVLKDKDYVYEVLHSKDLHPSITKAFDYVVSQNDEFIIGQVIDKLNEGISSFIVLDNISHNNASTFKKVFQGLLN